MSDIRPSPGRYWDHAAQQWITDPILVLAHESRLLPVERRVCAIAMVLWGESWCDEASRRLEINIRTLQRIRSAARDGLKNDQARGVMVRINEFLGQVSALGGSR